jgi:hypothetical protein
MRAVDTHALVRYVVNDDPAGRNCRKTSGWNAKQIRKLFSFPFWFYAN